MVALYDKRNSGWAMQSATDKNGFESPAGTSQLQDDADNDLENKNVPAGLKNISMKKYFKIYCPLGINLSRT